MVTCAIDGWNGRPDRAQVHSYDEGCYGAAAVSGANCRRTQTP